MGAAAVECADRRPYILLCRRQRGDAHHLTMAGQRTFRTFDCWPRFLDFGISQTSFQFFEFCHFL